MLEKLETRKKQFTELSEKVKYKTALTYGYITCPRKKGKFLLMNTRNDENGRKKPKIVRLITL
jgi:hypothetical protein